jgi:hypothetical protein
MRRIVVRPARSMHRNIRVALSRACELARHNHTSMDVVLCVTQGSYFKQDIVRNGVGIRTEDLRRPGRYLLHSTGCRILLETTATIADRSDTEVLVALFFEDPELLALERNHTIGSLIAVPWTLDNIKRWIARTNPALVG